MSGATIVGIRTLPVSMEAAPDLVVRGAGGAHARSDFLLVQVTGSNGVVGYGEVSATPRWSGEDAVSSAHFIADLITPALLGLPLSAVERFDDIMDSVLGGNMFTKAGVSIALWDAHARTQGVSMAEALGAVVRREIPIKCSLSGPEEHLRRAYAYAVGMGFTSFKVKVGLGVEGDVERVRLARSLAGPDAFLGTDANTGWSRGDAQRAIELFAPYGVAFVEQPIAARDLAGMAALRCRGVPILADESVGDMYDLLAVIDAGAADVVSIYVGMSGGPARALEMGRVAASAGLDIVIGSNGEMGIGAAAQLQVACALPELSTAIPSDIIGAHYYLEDILETPLASTGSTVTLPEGPGLGVRPRRDLIDLLEKGSRL